jgi:hypothetical protein
VAFPALFTARKTDHVRLPAGRRRAEFVEKAILVKSYASASSINRRGRTRTGSKTRSMREAMNIREGAFFVGLGMHSGVLRCSWIG